MAKPIYVSPDDLPQALELFWSKVKKTDNCWEWQGTKWGHTSYGVFWFHKIKYRAHRWIWVALNGEIPKDFCVCHTCDNPSCVRPDHLFLGTHTDNMSDCARKKRNGLSLHPERSYFATNRGKIPTLCGEKHPAAKLTEADVAKIRHLFGAIPNREIAERFNVSISAIQRILKGSNWTHTGASLPIYKKGDSVEWISQSRGYAVKKTGIVLAVIPPSDDNADPSDFQLSVLLGDDYKKRYDTSTFQRKTTWGVAHQTYLICAPGRTPTSRPKLYRPHLSALKATAEAKQ